MLKSNIHRFYLAIGGLIVVVLIALMGPVNQMLTVKNELNDVESQLMKLGQAPQRIRYIKSILKKMDDKIGVSDSSTINQQALFICLSKCSKNNQIAIREIANEHIYTDNYVRYETFVFILEGSFINILKMIKELKSQLEEVSILSLDFSKEKDRRSKKERLMVELILQKRTKNK